ncbi:hypothetical protein SK1NUM_17840 [Arachnia rubra]|nr:hypothetical protein SK1NUM_17840 [Arachnia rubra]
MLDNGVAFRDGPLRAAGSLVPDSIRTRKNFLTVARQSRIRTGVPWRRREDFNKNRESLSPTSRGFTLAGLCATRNQ